MHVDDSHWLIGDSPQETITRLPSVRRSNLDVPAPLGIVWHWTGGKGGPGFARNLAEGARTYLKGRDTAASWHVLIAKDGQVFQSVPLDAGSWHCGRPGRLGGLPHKVNGEWKATAFQGGRLFGNINRGSIGVELENAGRLREIDGHFYCWPYWQNPEAAPAERVPSPRCELSPERAFEVGGAWYDTFPDAQVDAARRMLLALARKYRLQRQACQYGHFMFDPGRKEDPGPFWMDLLLPAVLGAVFGSAQV